MVFGGSSFRVCVRTLSYEEQAPRSGHDLVMPLTHSESPTPVAVIRLLPLAPIFDRGIPVRILDSGEIPWTSATGDGSPGPNAVTEGSGPAGRDLLLPSLLSVRQKGTYTAGRKKLRAHQPLSRCALFRLIREVFEAPRSNLV
jgi:hypothetical protein